MGKFVNRLKKEADLLERNPDLKGQQIDDLLISIKMESGHIHAVLPNNEDLKNELIEDLRSDLPDKPITSNEPPKEVIFKNRQAIGDILTFTCAVRDFKKAFPNTRVGVISTARHIWDNNPYIDHQFIEGPITEIGPGWLTNKSNSLNLHMCNAFRLSIEQKLNISIPQGEIKPDIWLTEEEINAKPIIDGPYWIIIPTGAPGWPSKMYHRWQEVVDGLKDKIKIVQLGIKNQTPILEGVEDYTGTTQNKDTGIRDMFNMFYHSEGSLGLVSLHMHLSGAFGNPCVVVAGAREPFWFTNYFNHQYIGDNGCLPCATKACWACKLEGCKNLVDKTIPKCVDIIHPDEVIRAVTRYYDGGLLRYGEKSKRRPFTNVVREKKVFIAPKVDEIDEELLQKYNMQWGGGSVTDKDWIFIKQLLQKEKIKSILEFGTGLSTLLFQTEVDKIDSFETNPNWISKIALMADDKVVTHYNWDGKTAIIPQPKYDLTFMDGPAGGENREWSTKYCAEHSSKWVLVHDAGRKPEREWQEKYLTKDYNLHSKGGHRCHLWVKKESIQIDTSKPIARICTSMRGFGGSERSTLELMKGFIQAGYNLEYIPTGTICGPYLNNIPEGAIKRDWSYLTEPCDVFVLYATDTIWSYDKEQYKIMNQLGGDHKVMVLNYKIGKTGQVEWTKQFDKYLFLNRELEAEIIKRIPGSNTIVLAPPTDLTEFFKVNINYDDSLKLIRHSSQRDAKWPDYSSELITKIIKTRTDTTFYFMPPRSDMLDHDSVHKFKVNELPIPEFLSQGNCFWYHLPKNYSEGGPRVCMEAMACGLPCIVDNHSGMKDRVTDETGWRCNDEYEMIKVIKSLTPEILKEKGEAARERAKKEFVKERWIKEMINA